jgi:hypothetical protein
VIPMVTLGQGGHSRLNGLLSSGNGTSNAGHVSACGSDTILRVSLMWLPFTECPYGVGHAPITCGSAVPTGQSGQTCVPAASVMHFSNACVGHRRCMQLLALLCKS